MPYQNFILTQRSKTMESAETAVDMLSRAGLIFMPSGVEAQEAYEPYLDRLNHELEIYIVENDTNIQYEIKRAAQKYSYLCFLTGNTSYSTSLKTADCLIYNDAYIINILSLLESHHDIDFLVPPVKVSDILSGRRSQEDVLGQGFWCRSDHIDDWLKKPDKRDRTNIAYVMPDDVAGVIKEDAQDVFTAVFNELDEKYGVDRRCMLRNFHKDKVRYVKLRETSELLYIYGAGIVGRRCLRKLKSMGIQPDGFLVTQKNSDVKDIDELPVYELDEITLSSNVGIITAVSQEIEQALLDNLEKRDFYHSESYWGF